MDIDRRRLLGAAGAAGALGSLGFTTASVNDARAQGSAARYRRIGTEAAWASEPQLEGFGAIAQSIWSEPDVGFARILVGDSDYARRMTPMLADIGEGRLADMDRAGVSLQVLSLTSPGVQLFDADTAVTVARESNDILAATVRRYPERFAGLAAFAPQAPERAVREMERAVGDLGLNGFIVNSHTDGEYLDQEKFWPILEAAEALQRPIYIHPRSLPADAIRPFQDYGLGGAGWGFAVETGLHGMRLLMSGVFDRFPGLQIVLGHMGEGIPYWVYRFDYMYEEARRNWGSGNLRRAPSEYLGENVMITTSGMNHEPALRYCLEVLGPDAIMWAADYPYQTNEDAVAFLDGADIPEDHRVKIYSGNAERVFHLPPG